MAGETVAPRRRPWRLSPEDAWRRELYVVMFAVFAAFTGFTFVMPFLSLYVTQLGVSSQADAALWAGALFGVTPLLWGALAPFWSRLAGRYGYRRMMQFSLAMFAVLIAAMAFVTDARQLLLLRTLLGVFGGFAVLSVALASAIAPRERVGEASGLLQAAQMACGVAGPLLGGVVVDVIGIRRSFFVAAALCAVGCRPITWGFRAGNVVGAARASAPAAGRTKTAYLRLPSFGILLVIIVALQFIDRSFGPLLPLYIATLGAPLARVGTITGLVMMVGALAGSFAAGYAGRLSARRAPRPLLLGALAVGALCCLLIALAGHWAQLVVLRLLLGLLAGGALTLAYAVGGRTLPDDVRPAAFGALAGAGQIGSAVSPVVAGALARWSSLAGIFVLDAALYAAVLLWAWWALPSARVGMLRCTAWWPRLRPAPVTEGAALPRASGEAE